jgi:hypothetical protein
VPAQLGWGLLQIGYNDSRAKEDDGVSSGGTVIFLSSEDVMHVFMFLQ